MEVSSLDHAPGGGQVEVGAAEGGQGGHVGHALAPLRLDELLLGHRAAAADVDVVLLLATDANVVQLRFLEGET